MANNSLLQTISDECVKECPQKCDSINFDTKVEVTEKGLKETIVEIIPSHSPRIVYKETLKTDINQLIYNCGGILGLWFGLTPMKITDLLLESSKLYTFLRYLISFLIQKIKRFLSRISLLLINSYRLLLSFILLLKNSLLLAVKWIKILMNLAINFLKIIFLIIIFKFKELYSVFCRLIESLFRFVHFLVSNISLFLINCYHLFLSSIRLIKSSVKWIKILTKHGISFLKIIFLTIVFKCIELFLLFCTLITSLLRFVQFLLQRLRFYFHALNFYFKA